MLTSRISSLAFRCWQSPHVQVRSLSCAVLHRQPFHSQTVDLNAAPDKGQTPGRRGAHLSCSSLGDPALFITCCNHLNGAGGLSRTRNFSTSARLSTKELSEKGDLVYRGAISGMIRGVKIFSLSTSAIGLCLQPMLLFSDQELPMGLKLAFGGIINFLVFLNPLIIHYIAKKYVTELRWNRVSGVFTAVTWSFWLRRKEVQFTAQEVSVPAVPGMFTFLEARGIPLFLDPQGFQDNEAYVQLMGFDKPLDWELPPQGEPSSKDDSQRR